MKVTLLACWWVGILFLGGAPAVPAMITHRRRDFAYLPRANLPKNRADVFLVAVFTSAAPSTDRRSRIRAQWKKNVKLLADIGDPAPVVMKFAIGTSKLSSKEFELVHAEDTLNGDILLLADVQDLDTADQSTMSYNSVSATTEKVLFSLQWAVDNFDFEYFARLGDDAYFRVDEFYRQVQNNDFPKTMTSIGNYLYGGWSYEIYEGSNMKNTNAYPAGMGYIFTHDVAAWLAKSAGMLSVGFPEDGVVGSWLAGTKIKHIDIKDRIHDICQDCVPHQGGYQPCNERDILLHYMNTQADWNRIDNEGLMKC